MSYIAFAGFSVQHQEVQQFADCSNQWCGRLNTCTSWPLKFHAWVSLTSEVTQKWHFIKGFNIEIPEFLIQTHLRFVCRLFFAQIGYLELNCNPCADWKQRFLSLCWFLFIFFSVHQGCIWSVSRVFVECYKGTTLSDPPRLSRPALPSGWSKEVNLVSQATSTSCEVHCVHFAWWRVQLFSYA